MKSPNLRSILICLPALASTGPPAYALSVSTADQYIATYGQATHIDQYNEWLGLSSSGIDGLTWDPFLAGQAAEVRVETSVGAFWGAGDFLHFSLWVDWDRSGVFDPDEEAIDLDDYWFDYGRTISAFMIDVPQDLAGNTWMRARFAFGQDLLPNDALMGGAAYYGEVEDYLLGTSEVPEPSTWVLLSVGVLAVAQTVRFRRANLR